MMKCKYCNYDLNQSILFLEDSETGKDITEYPSPDEYEVCENCGIIGQYDETINLIPLNKIELDGLQIIDPEKFWGLMQNSYMINEFRFLNTKVNYFNVDKELIKNIRRNKNDN